MQAIKASVRHAKAHVQPLPRAAMMRYTMLLMASTMVTLLTGIGGRVPPMFNITICIVPGRGQALNITCESYAGSMNFGFTGCHASVPGTQKLALHTADAMAEQEAAWLPKTRRLAAPKKPTRKRAAAATRTAVRERP